MAGEECFVCWTRNAVDGVWHWSTNHCDPRGGFYTIDLCGRYVCSSKFVSEYGKNSENARKGRRLPRPPKPEPCTCCPTNVANSSTY